MEKVYKELQDFMVEAGERLKSKAGAIADVGVTKKFLTEEDVAIERGFKKIISSLGKGHVLYAEEENYNVSEAEHLWVADPISNTRTFIKGLPHYAIVISYVHKGMPEFAAVYDPAMGHMYTAYRGGGAFLNGKPIQVNQQIDRPRVIFNLSAIAWESDPVAVKLFSELTVDNSVFRNTESVAVNYGYVASGKFDAFISFVKDAFPEFAGSLIVREAGGTFITLDGREKIEATDRMFLGGNPELSKKLASFINDKQLKFRRVDATA